MRKQRPSPRLMLSEADGSGALFQVVVVRLSYYHDGTLLAFSPPLEKLMVMTCFSWIDSRPSPCTASKTCPSYKDGWHQTVVSFEFAIK